MKLFRRERPRQRLSPATAKAQKPNLNYYTSDRRSSGAPAGPSGIKTLKRRLNKTLLGLAAAAGLFYGFSLQANPKVHLIKPAPPAISVARDPAAYEQVTRAALKKSILSRSKLTLNTRALENEIMNQFPELGSVNVSLAAFSPRPTLILELANLVLLIDNGSVLFAVDDSGRAMVSAIDLPQLTTISLPVLSDQSRPDLYARKPVLTIEEVSFIQTILAQLASHKLSVAGLSLPALPDELHVRLQDLPYLIKFNFKTDAKGAVGSYLAAKAKLEADQTMPREYIDVRVEERAYYK